MVIGFTVRRTIVAIIFLTSCMSVKEIRDPIFQFFIEVYDTFSRNSFSQVRTDNIDDKFEYKLSPIPNGYTVISENKFDRWHEAESITTNGNTGLKYSNMGTQNIIWTVYGKIKM